ncbi:phosphatase PAP2 family protein [Candidatus Pacearchaeota archaeon]|nr:phosphatase PAP2 family protein [Candidatus Pacearchaeota archaeon]
MKRGYKKFHKFSLTASSKFNQRRRIILFLIFIALIFASFYFDSQIVRTISFLRNGFLNDFFLGITFLSSDLLIFFFLTSLFLWNENKRRWIFPLWLTLFLSVVASFLLKMSIQRMRPFELEIVSTLPVLIKESFNAWNYSFPSFQAMLVFCAIPILDMEFRKFKYFWIAFAVLVAFSRVYFGVHFMSDVLAGALIGYLIGLFVVRMEKEKKFGERIYEKIVERFKR